MTFTVCIRDVPEFKNVPVPVPAGIIIGSDRNKILLKTALFPNCFKSFHKLIQLTKTISDYGEEIKVFRQFLEEVCFFFLHICFRIRRTAFLNKQTDDRGDVRNFFAIFFGEHKCRIAQSKFRSGSGRNWKSSSGPVPAGTQKRIPVHP